MSQRLPYKNLLMILRVIVSSKVKLDDTGNLVEIHALADKSRNAKQIVRDIQSAVTAKFDLEIDHRIISIAQLSCDSVMQKDLRIVFKGMEVASKGLELDVKVMLFTERRITAAVKRVLTRLPA